MKYKFEFFAPWSPKTSCAAMVEVSSYSFMVETEGHETVEIPFERARITRGGFDSLSTVIESVSENGEKYYLQTGDERFIDFLATSGNPAIRKTASSLKFQGQKKRFSSTVSSVSVVVIFLALIYFLFSGMDYLVEKSLSHIPVSLENKLGEITISEFIKGHKQITSGPVFDGVSHIWKRVLSGVKDSPFEYKLYLVDVPVMNAMAAPGGHVVVFTGLLHKIENPEELAGILAHEIQHAHKRHGTKSILKSAGIGILFSLVFGDLGGLEILFRDFGAKLSELSYSRENEREADSGAVEMLMNARIDPMKFPAFFKRLAKDESIIQKKISIFFTHPPSEERETIITKLATKGEKPEYKPFEMNWKEFVQDVKRKTASPED
ncbi:MAG: M48 family metallopeptidase [Candidatus Riflebacteria bacterium]|nr:M48 family metallopeptidase [Candidatus Riflebacteria bacterium]